MPTKVSKWERPALLALGFMFEMAGLCFLAYNPHSWVSFLAGAAFIGIALVILVGMFE